MDKYALHLAFNSTKSGKDLVKNTTSSYFGNVKNHYLELNKSLRAHTQTNTHTKRTSYR